MQQDTGHSAETVAQAGEDDDRSIRVSAACGAEPRAEWASSVWPEDVIVRDGVVHFWFAEDEPGEKRQTLRVAAETISGVRGMRAAYYPAF